MLSVNEISGINFFHFSKSLDKKFLFLGETQKLNHYVKVKIVLM